MEKAIFELSWKYLNSCTYFTRPYYSSEGTLISFGNSFSDSLHIDVDQNYVYLECGSWSLKSKTWFHDYSLNVKEKTFEKAIVELYYKIHKLCGEDFTDDYYHINNLDDIKDCFVKQKDGNYLFLSDNSRSYWESDKLFEKIRVFEESANARNV